MGAKHQGSEMWLPAVFDWACSTKCTCYRARQIRVLGSHKRPHNLPPNPQHKSDTVSAEINPFARTSKQPGASWWKEMPNMVPRSVLSVLTGIKKPVGATSDHGANHGPVRQISRCGVAHAVPPWTWAFCQNPTFKDPPTKKPKMNKVEQSWQGCQPLSSIPETEIARQFCFAKSTVMAVVLKPPLACCSSAHEASQKQLTSFDSPTYGHWAAGILWTKCKVQRQPLQKSEKSSHNVLLLD